MSDQDIAYIAHRIEETLTIYGDLSKALLQKARKSARLVDMGSGRPGFYDTHMACTWKDTHFYLAFRAEEAYVEARLTKRDDITIQDTDV